MSFSVQPLSRCNIEDNDGGLYV